MSSIPSIGIQFATQGMVNNKHVHTGREGTILEARITQQKFIAHGIG